MRAAGRIQPVTEQPPGEDLEALLRQLIAEVVAAGDKGGDLLYRAGFAAGLAAAKPPERRRRAGSAHQPPIMRLVQ
jgi:hypothetical protein